MGLRALLSTVVIAIWCIASTAIAADTEPSKTLTVVGSVSISKTYSAKDLETLPAKEVILKATDGDRKYTGVLLRDIVAASKPLEPDQYALRQSYVIAKGTDGYFALFTWSELFLTSAGEEVFVVYKRDGSPLQGEEGLFATVALKDSRYGPRYVKWLTSIEFRRSSP